MNHWASSVLTAFLLCLDAAVRCIGGFVNICTYSFFMMLFSCLATECEVTRLNLTLVEQFQLNSFLFVSCVTTKRKDYSERNRANIQAHLCSCVVGQSEKLRLDAGLPAAALILSRWDACWHCRSGWSVICDLWSVISDSTSVCAETHLDMNSTSWQK